MAKLIHQDPMLHKLNAEITTSNLRPHSGLSGIGNPCHRQLQLYHYWAYQQHISARIQRLFNVGNDSEAIMIADLKKVGVIVEKQQDEIIGTAGHWLGHIDGEGLMLNSPPFLVEFKTHNQKSFDDLKKKGVMISKPVHYGQCQSYMGYKKYPRTLYMALNKNTSEYYIEWIEFDPEYFKDSKSKEMEVISAETLLPRIGNNNITWFECKFCDARNQCFGKTPINQSCRSCKYVDIHNCGVWACSNPKMKHKAKATELTVKEQIDNCGDYELAIMFKEL